MEEGADEKMIDKKFSLELKKEPSLVFVQYGEGSDFEVFQDGKKVKGVRGIIIDASIESITTHQIEFLTGRTK